MWSAGLLGGALARPQLHEASMIARPPFWKGELAQLRKARDCGDAAHPSHALGRPEIGMDQEARCDLFRVGGGGVEQGASGPNARSPHAVRRFPDAWCSPPGEG